jgi:diaminohydroxyphosphoribosylaminopyrimidine deaminase/5-amino-6-(5-phosphoribosylamino)uracil reductase
MVGALVVDDEGVVVGRGSHHVAGGPHAEVHALNEAGARARGATLYCTLEPCCHHGRTGPCAPRAVDAGIRRAVIAVEDPNPVAGGGIAHLRARGVDVAVGVRRTEAIVLNRPFFSVMTRRRPFITAKVALSLDARVAAAPGVATRLTGEAANRRVHRERAETDAIGVGSGTILADDPLLTARGIYRVRPFVRVVFDRRLRTPASARVLSTVDAGPVIIVTSAAAVARQADRVAQLRSAGAQLQIHEPAEDLGSIRLTDAVEQLAAGGVTSMVLEGGPALHRAAWDEGIVDRVQLFVTPQPVGARGVPWLLPDLLAVAELTETTVEPIGEDVLIQGMVATNVHWPR